MEEVVRLRLEDMLEHARLARDILGDADEQTLVANSEKRLAVAKAVEIIGEAANRIDPAQRSQMPSLPWEQMRGMRNRLIHDYGRVDKGILIDTIRNHIPPLIAEIERLLNENP
jgi:uncharacterized protein with HEPN domain